MSACEFAADGAVELYFYGEVSGVERAAMEKHLAHCAECRQALEDMGVIRAALGSRPDVAGPAGGDWTAFMARLDEQGRRGPGPARAAIVDLRPARSHAYIGYLAMAAVIALVTFSVLFVARTRQPTEGPRSAASGAAAPVPGGRAAAPRAGSARVQGDAAFVAMSEQHFERSKLVVLGLANRDARDVSGDDWAFERELAASLLTDTRLYRMAAEQRGMTSLAGVMGDLELVLLQTSMSERPDPETLEQLQRLIRKRNLVTKMEVVAAGL